MAKDAKCKKGRCIICCKSVDQAKEDATKIMVNRLCSKCGEYLEWDTFPWDGRKYLKEVRHQGEEKDKYYTKRPTNETLVKWRREHCPDCKCITGDWRDDGNGIYIKCVKEEIV